MTDKNAQSMGQTDDAAYEAWFQAQVLAGLAAAESSAPQAVNHDVARALWAQKRQEILVQAQKGVA